jgi:adhesin transport system outer membrane protein
MLYAVRMTRRAPSRPILAARAAAAVLVLAAPGAGAASIETVVRSALADFPAIRVAQANRNVAEFRIDEARARHLPVIDVGGAARVAGAAVSQPLPRARVNLWAGGAIDSAIDREQQRAASAERREAVTREDVAFGATQAYLRVLRAARLTDAARSNLDRHLKLVSLFEQIVRIDAGRRFDLVQAQARAQGVRGTLEDRLAELGSARQALVRFYPAPADPEGFGLPAVASIEPPAPDAGALQEHPAVVAARREVQAAEANARALRRSRGPRLDLEAFGGRDPGSQLVLSWPAFDPSLTAAERGAVAAQLGAEATLQDTERAVLDALRQAHQDFDAAGRRMTQARRQIDLASELVGIYFEQFRVGRRNLLDLLAAYAELANAEAAFAGQQVDQALARYRIVYAQAGLVAWFEGPQATLPTLPPPEPVKVPPYGDALGPVPGTVR